MNEFLRLLNLAHASVHHSLKGGTRRNRVLPRVMRERLRSPQNASISVRQTRIITIYIELKLMAVQRHILFS